MPRKTITSLAVLKVSWDSGHHDYLESFVPLFLHLIKTRSYIKIRPEEILAHFLEEFGLIIPLFPTIAILTRLKKRGYIILANHEFVPNSKKLEEVDFSDRIAEQERKMNTVITEFIGYAKEIHGIELTDDSASKDTLAFFKESDLSMLFDTSERSAFPNSGSDTREGKILFALFVSQISKNNQTIFEILVDLMMGHALATTILYDEKMRSFEGSFRKIDFYLDAGFIFAILGTSGDAVRVACADIADDLIKMGARLYVFDHTFDEVINILKSSLNWIGRPDLDFSKAGRTLRWFLSQDYSESDVQLFIAQVPDVLRRARINKVHKPDYVKQRYQIDEAELKRFIIEAYSAKVPGFDPTEKDQTILRDIESISAIYRLRKGSTPHTLRDASHIFMTSNGTLAQVSAEFERSMGSTGIPVCITDVFLGTLIWLQSPAQAKVINEQRLMAQLRGILQPSRTMLRRYIAEIEKLKANKTITEDDYYLMRAAPLIDMLPSKFLGDPDRITDTAVVELLADVRQRTDPADSILLERERETHEQTRKELKTAVDLKLEMESSLKRLIDLIAKGASWAVVGVVFIILALSTFVSFLQLPPLLTVALLLLALISAFLGFDLWSIRSFVSGYVFSTIEARVVSEINENDDS